MSGTISRWGPVASMGLVRAALFMSSRENAVIANALLALAVPVIAVSTLSLARSIGGR